MDYKDLEEKTTKIMGNLEKLKVISVFKKKKIIITK
jgi:hypothetical protein